MQRRNDLRNIAIIAHVDHGKTTLVDAMLRQALVFRDNQVVRERVMDSGELERERGITILAKNTAIRWGGVKINLVDTPGHADFGGEVERVLNMVDGVLVLVDAVEGPMPQTRFVLKKALELGLAAVLVVNKMDRPNARPGWALDRTFDLFVDLGASEDQADFSVVYTDAISGTASITQEPGTDLTPLFEAMLRLPAPEVVADGPLQLLVTNLDYDEYRGRIAIGRITSGSVAAGMDVRLLRPGTEPRPGRVADVFTFENLGREEVPSASAGEIVALSGLADAQIGDTVASALQPIALPPITVEQPTVRMAFVVNTSPFAGREGQYVTSRTLRDRLQRELERNVALQVEEAANGDGFLVSGRGELHLAILIETMRREGYELAVGRPEVITRDGPDGLQEPYEDVFIDVAEEHMGAVVELLGKRRGEMGDMRTGRAEGEVHLVYHVPTRGLLGLRNTLLSATKGTAILHTLFRGYGPWAGEIASRESGAIVAFETGLTTSYALNIAQERGVLFVGPREEVYAGQIVGESPRSLEVVIHVSRKKHVTNHRRSFAEDAIILTPPVRMSLDDAIEHIADDELVEVTPKHIRLRKKELDHERRQKAKKAAPVTA
jgi:GTP-binding protein